MGEIASQMEDPAFNHRSGFKRRVRRQETYASHNYLLDPFKPALRIGAAGVSRWRDDDHFRIVNRKVFSMNIITEGNAVFDQNGSRGSLWRGDVFLAHKGTTQLLQTGPAGFLHKRFMLVDGAALDTFLHASGLAELDIVRPRNPRKVIALFRKSLAAIQKKEPGFAEELSIIAHQVLMELGKSVSGDYPVAIRRAIEFIMRNQNSALTLKRIADASHMSTRHCNRMFKQHLGMSPMQFWTSQKLDLARSLLLTTEHSMKEVARMAGFEDPLYFSLRFKQAFGVSPTRFREGQRS